MDTLAFTQFWLAAQAQVQVLAQRKLAGEKRDLDRKMTAWHKTRPVFVKVLRGQLAPEEAGRRIKKLVADREMQRWVVERWRQPAQTTPEQRKKANEDHARRGAELQEDERLLKALNSIRKGLAVLAEAAGAGSGRAAEHLAAAANEAVGFLHIETTRKLEVFRRIARKQLTWPVLATVGAGWEKKAVKRIAELELGMDLKWFKAMFRQPRGVDANLPARRWAKAAVRAIEETRFRILMFGNLLRGFGSDEALAEFCLARGWGITTSPAWVSEAAKLKEFSTESLREWKSVVRDLVREQMRNFHQRPEWTTQRNSAAARGRDTPGELKNAILDDICSALERIAPAKEMPKLAC